MKQEVEVYWSPTAGFSPNRLSQGQQIAFEEPVQLLRAVSKEFPKAQFLSCPAVQDLYKNTYVIYAAMDMDVTVSKRVDGSYTYFIKDMPQHVANLYITIREDGTLTLPPAYVFYTDGSMLMETFPVPTLNAQLENATYIAGVFDIGKWVRPVDFTLIPLDVKKPIRVKRGDPLFCVRFIPQRDAVIRLVRVPFTQELNEALFACVGVKEFVKGLPLRKLYTMAEGFLSILKNKKR